MKRFIVFSILIFILGCTSKNTPISPEPQHGQFEIYLLKDSTLTGYQASQVNIDLLELEGSPWLTDRGLSQYDFSSHCLYLNDSKAKYFSGYNPDTFTIPLFPAARAFVVVAKGERCYVGSFHSAVLSSVPWGPYMNELSIWYYPSDVIHIVRSWRDTNDARRDVRVEDALRSVGVYHGGIQVDLLSVNVVKNADTSTVEYTFTVTNRDSEILYVLDPDKMGSTAFHYFTNGIVFRGTTVPIQSTSKTTSPPADPWDPGLYAQIPVSGSIQRTVRLTGYPKIPSGTYQCSFTFADPAQIEKEHRLISNGRIWLGDIASNQIQITVL